MDHQGVLEFWTITRKGLRTGMERDPRMLAGNYTGKGASQAGTEPTNSAASKDIMTKVKSQKRTLMEKKERERD